MQIGFHLWTRFEAISTLAFIFFIIAGLVGIVAVWLGLAWAPAAVVSVSPISATHIFVLEAVLITASVMLAFSARTMVVREWLRIAPTAPVTGIKNLHGFICGVGLMSAWSAILVPFYAAALFSISSFASLIAVGMLYASIRGFISGHAALTEYVSARSASTGVPRGRSAIWAGVAAVVCLATIFDVLTRILPLIAESRQSIVAPAAMQLEVVQSQISYQAQDLPISEQLYAERVAAETEALRREVAAMKRGVSSDADVHAARQRLLQAQMDGLRVLGEARSALANLRRMESELGVKLRHAQSAAPALPGR
jgi:hypothetical protein